MKRLFTVVAIVLSLATGTAVTYARMQQHGPQNLADVKWGPAPPVLPAGAQAVVLFGDPFKPGPFALRLKFPANYNIPAHSHPTDENVTVTSGVFIVGMGDKLDRNTGQSVSAGGFGSLPANMNHYAYTKVETTVVLFAQGPFEFKYVNPNDDPRNKK
jgi:quercetin dioxygenase-like cupin family protein